MISEKPERESGAQIVGMTVQGVIGKLLEYIS